MFKEKQRRGFMEEDDQILEINLISAQGLKTAPGNLRRMQTYVIAWVDPSNELRTRVDRLGDENSTWKTISSSGFLPTSSPARHPASSSKSTPSATSGTISSGRFGSACKNADLEIFHGSSAISFGDLTSGESVESEEENGRWKRRLSPIESRDIELSSTAGSCDLDLSSLNLS